MNIIAYALFILQIISLIGQIFDGTWIVLLVNFFFLDGNGLPGFFYSLGNILPAILGCILLSVHKKRKKKKHVVFYCDTCKNVVGGVSGKKCTCLNCRKMRREISALYSQWDEMSEEDQNALLNQQ